MQAVYTGRQTDTDTNDKDILIVSCLSEFQTRQPDRCVGLQGKCRDTQSPSLVNETGRLSTYQS